MFGRRRFFLHIALLTFSCIFSKWKFFGKPMPGWKVRNTQQTFFFFLFDMVAACVWVKIRDERVIKRESKKKRCGGDFLDAGFGTKKKRTASVFIQFVEGGGMKKWWFLNGMTTNIPMHAWKHTHTHSTIYTYRCAHRTPIRLLGVGVARLTHTTVSFATAVTHFMRNWNEVEHVEFTLQLIVALMSSLYSGSILI